MLVALTLLVVVAPRGTASSASSSFATGADGGAAAHDDSHRERAQGLPGGGLHADVSIACSGCAAVVRQVSDLLENPTHDMLKRTVREFDASAVRKWGGRRGSNGVVHQAHQ